MKDFIEYVKQNYNVNSIELEVEAINNKRLNNHQLTNFYSKFGFKKTSGNKMKLNLYSK
jgi:hypothetical protein